MGVQRKLDRTRDPLRRVRESDMWGLTASNAHDTLANCYL